jgi:hypothetical protein
MSDALIEELIAKQAIRDVLARYCRGLDRMDKEMAYGVWHEGATADYLDIYEGTGRGFIDWVWEAHAGMQCHSHQITNVLIDVQGDAAVSEAYVMVVLWTRAVGDAPQQQIGVCGRYLDRWSRRDDRWAIDHRTHVVDTHSVSELAKGAISARSRRDERDVSFEFMGKGGGPLWAVEKG